MLGVHTLTGKDTPSNRGGGGGGSGDFRSKGGSGGGGSGGGGKPSTPFGKGSSAAAAPAPAKGGKPPGYSTLPPSKGKTVTTPVASTAIPKANRSKSGTGGDDWQVGGLALLPVGTVVLPHLVCGRHRMRCAASLVNEMSRRMLPASRERLLP